MKVRYLIIKASIKRQSKLLANHPDDRFLVIAAPGPGSERSNVPR